MDAQSCLCDAPPRMIPPHVDPLILAEEVEGAERLLLGGSVDLSPHILCLTCGCRRGSIFDVDVDDLVNHLVFGPRAVLTVHETLKQSCQWAGRLSITKISTTL